MQEQAAVLLDFPFPEERVFRYQAMQDILHHLVNEPFEAYTQQELAARTGSDISTVSRSIALLEQLGVLDISDGKPARIAIDQNHIERSDPIFAVPQEEFRTPIHEFVEELTNRVGHSEAVDEVVGVVLFGSVARGTADRGSDIDLLLIVEGDGTYGRRIGSRTARDLEERRFDGDRYQFEVLVETTESATSHGGELREIFDEGIVLERSDRLTDVRTAVYADERGDA